MAHRIDVGDAIGLLVIVPPLVYGSGVLLWIGPSFAEFGVNVAPMVATSRLLFPGVVYVGTLVMSAVFAAVVGVERLAPPMRSGNRASLVAGEVLFWTLIILVSNAAALIVVNGTWPLPQSPPAAELIYVFLHVALLGFGFRRLFGLVRARLGPPPVERRTWTPPLRVLQGPPYSLPCTRRCRSPSSTACWGRTPPELARCHAAQ